MSWIGIVEDIGNDMLVKYREYLAECLEVRVGELRETIQELELEGDLEFLEKCKSIAYFKAWDWIGRHWSWRMSDPMLDQLESYFKEYRDRIP